VKDLTIPPDISIRDALKKLDKTGEKCLLVVNSSNKLLGTLTDGDLRRAILSRGSFSKSVLAIFNPKPVVVTEGYNNDQIKELFIKYKFDVIPIVDSSGFLLGFKTWEEFLGSGESRSSIDLVAPVIIMAGGKGTRLEPFTKILPKPLVPINEKPIIEHIIERFVEVGCKNFHLTVNYKGLLLKAYFEELSPNYSVSFIEEPQPLGTAGSLRYLNRKLTGPFFVTNCDIIIKTDYRELYNFHVSNDYDMTLVASAKEYIIPYGTCELNGGGHLLKINEKPSYDFLINTGLYILNPSVLEYIPENKVFHITHLIETVKKSGKKVGVFPIDDDSWVDVGQWAEYKKAIDKL